MPPPPIAAPFPALDRFWDTMASNESAQFGHMHDDEMKVLAKIAENLQSIKANTDRGLRELARRLDHVESVAEANKLLITGLLATAVDEGQRRRMVDVLLMASFNDETGMIRKRLEEFRDGIAKAKVSGERASAGNGGMTEER